MRALISILVDDDDDDDPGYCDIHLMAAVAPQMLQLNLHSKTIRDCNGQIRDASLYL